MRYQFLTFRRLAPAAAAAAVVAGVVDTTAVALSVAGLRRAKMIDRLEQIVRPTRKANRRRHL